MSSGLKNTPKPKPNMSGRQQAGTGGAPYQSHSPISGGDFSDNPAKGDMAGIKKVADNMAKPANPQAPITNSSADMKPMFYKGQAINNCGPDR